MGGSAGQATNVDLSSKVPKTLILVYIQSCNEDVHYLFIYLSTYLLVYVSLLVTLFISY